MQILARVRAVWCRSQSMLRADKPAKDSGDEGKGNMSEKVVQVETPRARRIASVIVRIASPQRSILNATVPITPRSETLGAWARLGTGALPFWLIPPLDFAGAGAETAGVDPAGGGSESGAKEDSGKGCVGSAVCVGHALLSLEKLSRGSTCRSPGRIHTRTWVIFEGSAAGQGDAVLSMVAAAADKEADKQSTRVVVERMTLLGGRGR
ncbi:hypothetical protein DFH08DRAFT_960603 [Mycena albidolilacea]|uniref:Uncharacterized protein n=1 Tax=Mycena albidolilacea TaxID=1033008 RepID=A0AAD7A0R3_9AGAR|nr:hypothetical protein DFH08DRAFT_960603 [Mycena albidolilacea]